MIRWTAIDKVLEMDPEKGARGLRNVPNTLDIFDSHFPRFPVLPGVLILGSLGELAERHLELKTRQRWRLARATTIQFRLFVQPGDQMLLAVDLKEFSATSALYSATVKVNDKAVTVVRKMWMAPRTGTATP
jgi:3-hydroxyacyl-[acyl-carrier-protein] dehydratase